MCGINGIFRFNGQPVEHEELALMNAKMVHRGPDDEGFHLDNNAGLSMRRLSIIDINRGHQPIANEDGRFNVVLNGEIYNYLELREELLKKGHQFKTDSDTEVLVHLYEDMREACLDKLNGMFAFAIWDSHTRELFIATDRLGIKPFFYYHDSGLFCFSSELKSLLSVNFERELDYQSVLLYLYLLYVPTPKSMIKNVRKLEPATFMKVSERGAVTKKTYWSVNNITPDSSISPGKARERTVALLSDAVRLQLRSDVPVGTFLSGGIDSSCVVAMLSRMGNGEPVRTFSVSYEGHSLDERPFARQVAEMYNTEHRELYLTMEDVKNNFERIIRFMDEPIGDSAAIPTFLLSEMARDAGVKVILNGTGGDEIFGGYKQYARGSMLFKLRNNLKAILNMISTASLTNALRINRPVIRYMCEINRSLIGMRSFLRDEQYFKDLLADLENTMSDTYNESGNRPEVDRLMNFDLQTYLVNDLFFLLDKMTMGASIEGRVPLVDHRMVELMTSVPGHMRMAGNQLKGMVKQALEGILPHEVLYRKKMGFGAPVSYWLNNGLLDDMAVLNGRTSPFTHEIFKTDEIRQAVRNKQFGSLNAQWIYNLAVFELWHRDMLKTA